MDRDEKMERMGALYADWRDCEKCGLCRTRTKVVFGEGNPDAQLMIIGEAPGEHEDLSGNPFQGRGGEVVDDFLSLFNSNREEVFIANILACRPPDNRDPTKEEMKACLPRLYETIRLVDPYIILLLGSVALKALTNEKRGITKIAKNAKLPGVQVTIPGVQVPLTWPAYATFHPAYLLRNWTTEEGGDVHMAYLCWEKAFKVSDSHAEHYRGITPPLRRKQDGR